MRIAEWTCACLLLGSTFSYLLQADEPTLPDLSSYPQTNEFKSKADWVFAKAGEWRKVQEHGNDVLAITAFFGGTGAAIWYSVSDTGRSFKVRVVEDEGGVGAMQNERTDHLSKDAIEKLRTAISELPRANSYPPVGNLLLVGFQTDKGWTVRSIDNRALPPAMQKIYGIVGESFETVQQRTGHP